jgi:DNA polymerase III sliding clamp (beta) subunit (PCNA family)
MNIQTSVLQEALKNTMYFVSRRSTMAVYTHFLLDARDGTLKIGGANFSGACRWDTEVPCDEDLFVSVPSKIFYDDVNGIEAHEVRLTTEDHKLVVRTPRHTARIDALPGEEFPQMIDIDGFTEVDRSLLDAIMTCSIAVDTKDANPTLRGMHLRTEGNHLQAYGTDGKRAGYYRTHFPYGGVELGVTVPKDSASAIGKASKNMDSIEIATNGNVLALRHAGTMFTSQLLDGNFPHVWESFEWKETDFNTVSVQAGDFKNTLKRALVFSKDGLNGRVDLSTENQSLVVTAISYEFGKSVTEIPAEAKDGIEVSINAQFLSDFVGLYDDDETITMFVKNPTSPVYMRGGGLEGFEYVAMPISVDRS